MARKSHKQELALRQDPLAPTLFDDQQMPTRLDVLRAVQEKRYEHKGVRLLEDEQQALRLVEMLMARWGLKKIARAMGISKWTVKAARDALVSQGKMAPYKQRVVELMEAAIEAGLEHYVAGIEEGLVAPAQIPIGMGIVWDKRALALSEPTAIVAGLGDQGAKALSVEQLNAWVENLRSVDSPSTDNGKEPDENEGK